MKYTHLGLTMVVIFGLCLFVGYKVDDWFGTNPVGTVSGIVSGVVFGFGFFIMEIYKLSTGGGQSREKDTDGP